VDGRNHYVGPYVHLVVVVEVAENRSWVEEIHLEVVVEEGRIHSWEEENHLGVVEEVRSSAVCP